MLSFNVKYSKLGKISKMKHAIYGLAVESL